MAPEALVPLFPPQANFVFSRVTITKVRLPLAENTACQPPP
jgi:hypothetical protein